VPRSDAEIDRLYGLPPAYADSYEAFDGALLASSFGDELGCHIISEAQTSLFEEYLPEPLPDDPQYLGYKNRVETLLNRIYPLDAAIIRLRLQGLPQTAVGRALSYSQGSVCIREGKARQRMVIAADLPDISCDEMLHDLLELGLDPAGAILGAGYYWLPSQTRVGALYGHSQGRTRHVLTERVRPRLTDHHPLAVLMDRWLHTSIRPTDPDYFACRGGEARYDEVVDFLRVHKRVR